MKFSTILSTTDLHVLFELRTLISMNKVFSDEDLLEYRKLTDRLADEYTMEIKRRMGDARNSD